MNVRLTLLLPQLIWPEPEDRIALEKLGCPSLGWLLARGIFSQRPALSYENTLGGLFGLDTDAPFGALRLLGEAPGASRPDARDGFWLCADPVHLRFHHERIILADAGAFDLSAGEAEALATDLNREFADIGIFHVADARRWYVRLMSETPFSALPLSAVAGRRIDGELSGDSHSSRLRSWLNEIQMFLHGHPVNGQRAAIGQPAVNSLWLWGAGVLPAPIKSNCDGVWARDPLALGHARAIGIPSHPLPRDLATFLSLATPRADHLVVLDSLLPPVLYEDNRGWHETMENLETNWFAPLRSALGKPVDLLTILAPTVYGLLSWEVKSADRWKIWRKSQSLAALAKEFAQ